MLLSVLAGMTVLILAGGLFILGQTKRASEFGLLPLC